MKLLTALIIVLTLAAQSSTQSNKGVWSEKAQMLEPRGEVAAATVDGKIYVLGGSALGNDAQTLNEEYDPTTNAWRGRAPIGRLVDIGGRRLHLYCLGRGAPTVIMENGQSSFSIDWALVQPKVARVIDYGNGDLVRIVQLSDATFS